MNNPRLPIARMLTFGMLPGCIKKFVYRLQGNQIGRHVRMQLGSVIVSKERFSIGDYTTIGYFTSISARQMTIGNHTNIRSAVLIKATKVVIGNDVTISETSIIRAGHLSEQSELVVDDLVHIFPHTTIDPSCRVHLHEECAVGPGCSIFTHGSYKSVLDGYRVSYGNVDIGKRVELTYNVFVTQGVCIGDDAVVAYGSYVNHDIPAGVLAAGCPAVVKRQKEQFAPMPSADERAVMLNDILTKFDHHLDFLGVEHDNDSIVFNGNCITVGDSCQFDLVAHKCDHSTSPVAKELRRFLSRYGIRFVTR